ncbi:zinc-dependent alcohol dehydrogenase family protein [Ottowia thiooxydans]|uniref:zinc-dependent alcohol dehydrogenase family protein n=1 Tax=Ottowia thiooxydans TaxID=219182 RepID=UPI00040CDE4B|nr:zinc-dependent alcohol dehydrogenase family protein [Ottowia thiooxydans]
MKAMVLSAHGGEENFRMRELPRPAPEKNQVLVKIAATSINPIDLKIRGGLPIGPELPAVLGCDFSGTVSEVGAEVQGFAVGDAVYACAGGVRGQGGALAEYIACDADFLAHKPSTLSFREAAALPLAVITAWQLVHKASVAQGELVLVHGGVGGVGHLAVQISKALGARVATTVRGREAGERALQLGADDIIEFEREEVSAYVDRLTGGRGFDVVIDTVGGANLDRSLQAAAQNGRVSVCAARSVHDLSPMHAKALSLHVVFMLLPMLNGQGRKEHGDILKSVAELCERAQLRPLLDEKRFRLEQAGDAHTYVEKGKLWGKVVVNIEDTQ